MEAFLQVVVFITICYVLTIIVDFIVSKKVFRDSMINPYAPQPLFQVYGTIRMFLPFASAVIVLFLVDGFNAIFKFLHSWFKINWIAIRYYFLAPFYTYVALAIYLSLGRILGVVDLSILLKSGDKSLFRVLGIILVLAYPASITVNALVALGEELGWRAFLVPRLLQITGLPLVVLATGIVWGLWHVPMVLLFKFKVPHYFTKSLNVTSYLILCTLLSIPAIVMTLNSKSILPAISLHGSVNALWRLVDVVTKISKEKKYWDLFKALTASITGWIVSITILTYVAITLL